jgi:hypothetical protein
MGMLKPLVLNSAGQMEQIQSGDTLDAVVAAQEVITQTNDEASPIVIGMPVYNDAADGVKKAKADASGTSNVVGLVGESSIAGSGTGSIKTSGILTATTTEWDAVVVSGSGGLLFGNYYFLDITTAGKMLSAAPALTNTGKYLVYIGKGMSTTEMKISIGQPILL